MKLIIILCIAFVTCFFSCTETPTKEKTIFVTDTTRVQDTVIFIKDSTMAQTFADSLPLGAYQGMFPSKGYEGIQQTIIFSADKKYNREEMLWGSAALPQRTDGRWERKEGKIWLYHNNKPVMKFRLKKDTLINVEANSTAIKDSMKYVMTQRNLASDRTSWDKKKAEGIDFVGIGNEPFWSLEIDNEKLILFKLADWQKPVIVPIEKPVINKDSTFYSLPIEDSRWTVTIIPHFCSDGMSDFLYQYKTIVRYKGSAYEGCGVMLNNAERR